jgi:histidinol-phosphate/aromatic aminotransferase/cobyric acid decarboxylase-like protein
MDDYEILINPRTPDAIVFDEDFDDVASYFSDIVKARSWSALPGGVMETFVPFSSHYEKLTLTANDFSGYRIDAGQYISSSKKIIASGLTHIEGRELSDSDFTLCPSVSFALLVILMALKRNGIQTIVAELPAYFACIEQALILGFRVLLWPTLPNEGYTIAPSDLEIIRASAPEPIGLLITQPRYGMGFLRSHESIVALRASLGKGDVLIIDEAADQSVPSTLADLSVEDGNMILRARGLTKGLGLNSARIAAVFHPPQLRALFGEIVDFAGGALDAASLAVAVQLCENPRRYGDFLSAALRYVKEQREVLDRSLYGTRIALSPIESGYIGTAHVFLPDSPASFDKARRVFLECCRFHRMPVVSGSSMYFPYTGDREIIRINYFTSEQNIVASGAVLSEVVKSLDHKLNDSL